MSLILKIDEKLVSKNHLEALEEEIEQLFKQNKNLDGVYAVNEMKAI